MLGELRPIPALSLGAELGLSQRVAKIPGSDEFSSGAVDSNGNPVQRAGWARSTSASPSVYATWRFHRWFGATGELRGVLPGATFISPRAAFVSVALFARTDELLEPRWLAP